MIVIHRNAAYASLALSPVLLPHSCSLSSAEAPVRRAISWDLVAMTASFSGGGHSCAPCLSFLTSYCFSQIKSHFYWSPLNTVGL